MTTPAGALGTIVVVPAARAVHREAAPPPPLAAWIEATWTTQIPDTAAPFTHLVLPDGCCDLILTPAGRTMIAGPGTTPVRVAHGAGERWRGVRLRPGALGALLGAPAPDLRDALVPLSELAPGLADDGDPLALVERLVAAAPAMDPEVAAMVQAVRAASDGAVPPTPRGLGPRQARRRFTALVGIAPKRFARIVRAQAVLATLAGSAAGAPGLARLAAAHGYVDQSHLAAELGDLAGAGPRTLLEALHPA